MDDLGAEHLSELSVNGKNAKSVDTVKTPDSVGGLGTAAREQEVKTASPADSIEVRAILGGSDFVGKTTKSDTNPMATPRARRYKERAILGGGENYHHHHHNEADEEEASIASSDGREKTDATPENVKKIDDVIQVAKNEAPATAHPTTANGSTSNSNTNTNMENDATKTGLNEYGEQNNNMVAAGAPLSTPNSTIADDDGGDESSASSAKQQCLAFTIDFGDSSAKDTNSAAAAKYKSMVERFQNRHRRGASMSKLEGADSVPPLSVSCDAPTPTQARSPRAPSETPSAAPESAVKVKMRARDRSASRVRDASKRHSWSPRSSTADPHQQHHQNHNHPKVTVPPKSPTTVATSVMTTTVTSTTTTTKKLKPKPPALQMPPHDSRKERQSSGKPFTPRSTAMQMALQKIDFLCPQPPLDDYHHLAMNDNVSEAGTYTLDGDNYTEEQKELMNIDKTTTSSEVSSGSHLQHQRPKDLPLKNTQTPTTATTVTASESRRTNNVLEVNYYHDTAGTPYKHTNKTSYLEKIKSRVRSITAKQQQQQQQTLKETSPPDADVGTFTSVTTSGVLAKQTALDSRPKLTRRSSLSTSQIDSSEYVSTESKLKSNAGASYNGGFTDHQKAGYRLNVFTNQTDSQILNAIESPDSPVSKLSDTAGLKTAQTKNDWIQEWARNARARSVASAIKSSPTKQTPQLQQHDIMSRSYNCGPGDDDILTDDSIIYRNKAIDRFRMGDFDYASDPNVSAQRPPKSPTKIPSPLHTIGRARSASHTRASLQNIIQDDPNNTDLYLQKTAAAISNLQQSLSRKNSLKSPPSSRDSPKKLPSRHHHTTTTTTHQYFSADEYSPQHSIEAKMLISNPLHKRPGNNMMSNSYHEQLVLDVKIPRARKNSYDAQALTVSPARRHQNITNKQQYYNPSNIDQTRVADSSTKQHQSTLSPLRRSSSFSAKCKLISSNNNGAHPKRPTAPLYTPPSGRHNYMAPPVGVAAIKKSASSTTFRQVYSDYDDNVAYYINDEDDLIDVEYYGSSDEDNHSINDDYEDYNDEDISQHVHSEVVQTQDTPLSNTRLNKALLMRIERSKQKVAGNNSQATAKSNLLAGAGMIACPNTPELPRRAVKSAPRSSMRQSMPRDSSLSRLAGPIPNSLASAKKQILQTANAVAPTTNAQQKRVQPKYMDISKYKPVQGNNFLRKNEAKSTLKPEIRRSPSSASMGLSRTEPTRTSNRSVKSATSGRGTSAARRDASVTKQKEVELAMWKRRATYDPMRAAAEDRRKKEEAKKSAQTMQGGAVTESSTVTRSQSFHSGVGSLSGNTQSSASNQQSLENRWTMVSNESSDEENAYASSITNRS